VHFGCTNGQERDAAGVGCAKGSISDECGVGTNGAKRIDKVGFCPLTSPPSLCSVSSVMIVIISGVFHPLCLPPGGVPVSPPMPTLK